MKATVKENHEPLGFPKIMILKLSGLIVLFHDDGKGIVLSPGDSYHKMGKYVDSFSMKDFEDFNGIVELKN